MQPDAAESDHSWTSRSQPTHPCLAGPLLGQPAIEPSADPAAAHTLVSSADLTVDLEAQSGVELPPQEGTANTTTAVCDLEHRRDSYDSGLDGGSDVTDEPADVAAERAKADRLWAARDMHNGGSTNFSGPAILLHNLRKVCKGSCKRQLDCHCQ